MASRMLMSFSVDDTQLQRKVNLSNSFTGLPFSVEMWLFVSKYMYSVLSTLTWRSMPPDARSRLCSRDLARTGVFVTSAMSLA